MRSILFPERATEATIEQLIATGGAGGFGIDPIDGDSGYRPAGQHLGRDMPVWTLDKARAYSVAAYRVNPMARAILDTYTSFCVGDSGVTPNCNVPEVRAVVDGFWKDPKVNLGALQEVWLRTHLIMGETCNEMLVGAHTGVVRFSPIDPTRVVAIDLLGGNPLWPDVAHIRTPDGDTTPKSIVAVDDITGLRTGDVFWWASFKALTTDRRGAPFLGPILDWLDDYDQVISNLVDRTAMMRWFGMDVTLKGADDTKIADFIRQRGGVHVPASGTVEVHNESVEWKAMNAQVGAAEDTQTAQAIMTSIASGTGLAKTWLAEPEGANRATSLTMAEPVRRRVGGVQNMWLDMQTEFVRYVVDQAVSAGRIPSMVASTDVAGGEILVPASQTVTVTGPEIAQSDAQVTAVVLTNLSKSLTEMVVARIMTPEAARVLVRKAWEQFAGIPYNPELDKVNVGKEDELADVIDKSTQTQVNLRLA